MREVKSLLSIIEGLEKGCQVELGVEAFKNEMLANRLQGYRYLWALSGRDYGVAHDVSRGIYVFIRRTDKMYARR